MTPVYRVSNLAAFARWKAEDTDGIGWLYNSIFTSESTEAQERGTAFHKALETLAEGEYQTVEAMGYTFAFTCDAELALPRTREIRRSKDYGGIIISGQCDGIEGRTIIDHKSTTQGFDAEYHLDGWQHRFYLDLFEADRFDWHVWECKTMDDAREVPEGHSYESMPFTKPYCVYAHHLLTQYRYPELQTDCLNLALEFKTFAERMGWHGIAQAA